MRRLALLTAALLLTAATTGSFTILLDGLEPKRQWWDAPYARSLPSGAGWRDGDRVGYGCAWMFLEYQGEWAGRTTFVKVPGASYAFVNDRAMVEGQITFAGRKVNVQQTAKVAFCKTLVSLDYAPYYGPDERPVIQFVAADGTVLETRDYRNTEAGAGIKFRLVEATSQRVTVVAYENNLPVIVVYYSAFGGSSVTAGLP